jgi:hypothetical protein
MTMLATLARIKQNAYDAGSHYDDNGYARPVSERPLAPTSASIALSPAVAATPLVTADPVHSAGGAIPIPNNPAPYVAPAFVPSSTGAAKPAIDKKYLIIGAVLLIVVLFFVARR